jgi:hypothetical protein
VKIRLAVAFCEENAADGLLVLDKREVIAALHGVILLRGLIVW